MNKLPPWFRQEIPDISQINRLKKMFGDSGVHTVCQSSRCPNLGECWRRGVATFMILGDVCSRACRFCAVASGLPQVPDVSEPARVARMVESLGLEYVVITSVTRDDLLDYGAGQFIRTVEEIRKLSPETKIELLIPDFRHNTKVLQSVMDAEPDVIGHNMETVARLYPDVRPKADYGKVLELLRFVKNNSSNIFLKSGFMVGLGESDREIIVLINDLKDAGCEILTIGQYLAPSESARHVAVDRFVTPETFDRYKTEAEALGFLCVSSAPLVRSSYFAEESFRSFTSRLKQQEGKQLCR